MAILVALRAAKTAATAAPIVPTATSTLTMRFHWASENTSENMAVSVVVLYPSPMALQNLVREMVMWVPSEGKFVLSKDTLRDFHVRITP